MDVVGTERTRPAGELQEDSVGIHEVDAAHEDAGVELIGYAPLTVIVVGHLRAIDTGGHQSGSILLDLLRSHVECDMVHGANGTGEVALVGPPRRGTDARHPVRCVWEPEEGQGVPTATVEEEVLPHARW